MKLTILLDLNVNYGPGTVPTDSSNNFWAIMARGEQLQSLALAHSVFRLKAAVGSSRAPGMLSNVSPRRSPSNETCAPPASSSHHSQQHLFI